VEECTYFWGVNTSWGIDATKRKGPLHQEDNQAPQPTGSRKRDEESDKRRAMGTHPNLVDTVRSLMVELQSCKTDNERMMKEQEKQTEINAVLLQSLSDLQ
jgi:hypothetical protein